MLAHSTHAGPHVSIERAAEILGVVPRTVRRLIAAGELPAYRIGKRIIRIRESDVAALLRPIPAAGPATSVA